MKTKRLKITTMDEIMNHKVQRLFTYNKDMGAVEDNDGRGYFVCSDDGFIRTLHHLAGRKDEWEPLYDLLSQYLEQADIKVSV
jgi:hypothetical protein